MSDPVLGDVDDKRSTTSQLDFILDSLVVNLGFLLASVIALSRWIRDIKIIRATSSEYIRLGCSI